MQPRCYKPSHNLLVFLKVWPEWPADGASIQGIELPAWVVNAWIVRAPDSPASKIPDGQLNQKVISFLEQSVASADVALMSGPAVPDKYDTNRYTLKQWRYETNSNLYVEFEISKIIDTLLSPDDFSSGERLYAINALFTVVGSSDGRDSIARQGRFDEFLVGCTCGLACLDPKLLIE